MSEVWNTVEPYVVGTIKGFGAGAFAAGLGYAKNKGEPFDGVKFVKTMLVGGVVGACLEGWGMTPDETKEWLTYPFIVYSVDVVAKAVWFRVLEPVTSKVRKAFST